MAKELLRVEHIGMKFNLSKERVNDFREYVIRMLKGKKLEKDEFWALKDINFSIHEGERIGILGLNGAGKSTLLKVVAGVFKPTEGRVIRNGKIVPLLELGAGFDKDYTGRENIFLYGAVLGYGRQYMEEKYDQIVEFSGLEDFMDVPIKNYSSGMKSRLGFSISLALNPDIFIVDEALSVGDKGFAKKCMKRMMKLRDEEGKTIFFISHSLSQVREFCKTGMWIEGGQLVEMGDIDKVCDDYSVYVDKLEAMSKKEKKKFLDEKFEKRLLPKKEKKGIAKLFG